MQHITRLEEINNLTEIEKYKLYITEELSTSYPIIESNEPFINLEQLAKEQNLPIVIAPVAPETTPDMYMRVSAAQKIMDVIRTLQSNSDNTLTLKVTDTFRPLSLQRKYFEEISNDIAQKEGLTGKALWKRVTQFIADPEKCPPHSTGGAIDCTLIDLTNHVELDMGTVLDSIDDASNTWSTTITDEQKRNRMTLFEAMIAHNFINLTSEWWHYSHGDQYWAIVKGAPNAIYSSQEEVTLT